MKVEIRKTVVTLEDEEYGEICRMMGFLKDLRGELYEAREVEAWVDQLDDYLYRAIDNLQNFLDHYDAHCEENED